mmetsp:Transcript_16339/g.39100  ORF Transcript_16339/g.39100 Transcript_16339/m.39100 type:complete len:207 (+) Transcript_16339:670-1290(+)
MLRIAFGDPDVSVLGAIRHEPGVHFVPPIRRGRDVLFVPPKVYFLQRRAGRDVPILRGSRPFLGGVELRLCASEFVPRRLEFRLRPRVFRVGIAKVPPRLDEGGGGALRLSGDLRGYLSHDVYVLLRVRDRGEFETVVVLFALATFRRRWRWWRWQRWNDGIVIVFGNPSNCRRHRRRWEETRRRRVIIVGRRDSTACIFCQLRFL